MNPTEPTTEQKVDEILAFGYTDPTFIHDIHVLVGGEDKVAIAKTQILALINEGRVDELVNVLPLNKWVNGDEAKYALNINNRIATLKSQLEEGK